MDPVPLNKVQDAFKSLSPGRNKPANDTAPRTLQEVQDAFKTMTEPRAPAPKADISAGAKVAMDTDNQWSAATQRTTPILKAHAPNYLGDAFETDTNVHFKDESGNWIPVNPKQHVVLQDPEDGKHKVFARSKETDEGMLSALGRIISQGAVTGVMPTVQRTLTGTQKVMGAADRLADATGVEVRIPKAVASDSKAIHATGGVVSHLPGGAGPLVRGAETMSEDLSKAAARASELPAGTPVNAEIAGGAVRDSATQYIKPGREGGLNKKVNAAYDKVDDLMPPEHLTKNSKLDETTKVAQAAQTEFEAMRKTGINPAIEDVLGAVTHPEGVGYQGLKRLRHEIGNLLDNPPQGMDAGTLRQLYGALSKDLKELILQRRVDGSVPLDGYRRLEVWERANTMAGAAAARREKIAKLLGTDTKSDEAIFHAVARAASNGPGANADLLHTLKKSVDASTWNEVTTAMASRLGRRVGQEGAEFNPGLFLKDYGNISDRAKELLFGKPLRAALDDIATIAGKWDTARELTHSPGEVAHIAGVVGAFHKPLEFLGAVTGINALSRALAKPATAKSVAKWMRRYDAIMFNPRNAEATREGFGAWTPANKRAVMRATQEFANELGRDDEMRQEFMKYMGTSMKGVLTTAAIASHLVKKSLGLIEEHGR